MDIEPKRAVQISSDVGEIRIDFMRIISFFREYKKHLILGIAIGLTSSLLFWFAFGAYKAQVNLQYQWGNSVTLRSLFTDWVELAQTLSSKSNLPEGERMLYQALGSYSWWDKAVQANYSVVKSDLKDLIVAPEAALGTQILSLTVTAHSKDQVQAKKIVVQAAEFMRVASSYIAARNLLKRYQKDLAINEVSNYKRFHAAEIELARLIATLSNLEELQKRYPVNITAAHQLTGLNESTSKYLPLVTQIIAAKSDVYAAQERVKAIKKYFDQAKLMEQFLQNGIPLLSSKSDGVLIARELTAVVDRLRASLSTSDWAQLLILDDILIDLTQIILQYEGQQDIHLSTTVSRSSGWFLASIWGVLGGLFVSILLCLGLQYSPSMKRF